MGSIGQEGRRISFEFNLDKFVNAVAYFAEKTGGADKLKLKGLLYLADKKHLVKYGMPIIGDRYYRLPYGPVPSKSLNILNDAIEPTGFYETERDKLNEYVSIDKKPAHPLFMCKKSFDKDVFSEAELKIIEEISNEYSKYNGGKLIDITHSHSTWLKTADGDEIDYRLFFEGDKDVDKSTLELMEIEQEDRNFTAALQKDLKDD